MENRTIENILNRFILEKLEKENFIDSREICSFIDEVAVNDDDIDELISIIFNSTEYNYIITENGNGYIFGAELNQVKEFIKWANENINSNDTCWNAVINVNGNLRKLNYFYNEVKDDEE